METIIANIFIRNWQQKAVALLTAIILWFFVSHSIMETKIIPSVPIRVVNIPPDYTILNLMPNGILQKRITLTVTGTKDIIEDLEPGDLEVVIDASLIDHNDWVMRITKNNLVSLTSVDLRKHISSITYSEYVVKIRQMVTEEIPITMLPPKGDAPKGYELLDIWPQHLVQTYSGAEEEIQQIKTNGLELQFDLNRIHSGDLDSLATASSDEITYYIPNSWKRIRIPCKINTVEDLNDPDAGELQIDFLKKQVLPVNSEIPIRVFYPIESESSVNPNTYPLAVNDSVKINQGVTFLNKRVYVHDVTKEFLDIIKDNIEIVITASMPGEQEILDWSVEVINARELEANYIKSLFKLHPRTQDSSPETTARRTKMYQKRFREYMQKLELYASPDEPLNLEARFDEDKIIVNTPA